MDLHGYSSKNFMDDPKDHSSLPLGMIRTAWAFQTSRIEGYRKMIEGVGNTVALDPLEDYDPGYGLNTQEPYKAVHKMRDFADESGSSGPSDSRDHQMYSHLWPSYPLGVLIGRQGGTNAPVFDMVRFGSEYYRSLPSYLSDAYRVDVADKIMDLSSLRPLR